MKIELVDKAFIQAPASWPAWPMLPLKRDKSPTLGFMFDGKGFENIIILENMFAFSGINDGTKMIKYDSVDALLADGWYVD